MAKKKNKRNASKNKSKKTVCLNMIVKNEEHVLHELFATIKKYIDYWVICDTGSTDNTKQLIIDYFKKEGIPGDLVEEPWKNFGYNRSVALKHCKGKADYIWVIDADDLVVGDLVLPNLIADAYSLQYGDGFTYMRTQIFNNKLDWEYVGVLHEYPNCTSKKHINLQPVEGNYYISSRRLGDRNKVTDKYLRDAKVLEEALKDEPNNSRYVFYLAQSYMDHGDFKKAIKWYKKRVEMKGWFEEVYYSYYRIAKALVRLGIPWEHVEQAFDLAHQYLPSRCEPLYHIAYHYRCNDEFEKGYKYAKEGSLIPYPKDQVLFLYRNVYDYKIWDELAICAYYTGRYQEAADVGFKLLREGNVPKDQLDRVRTNLKYSLDKLKNKDNNKVGTVCFYTGYSDVTKGLVYGSELALLNVAEQLTQKYNVYIFSPMCTKEYKKNKVNYKPAKEINEFQKRNSIDIMIISRYIHYFLEYESTAKKTYIWVHDTYVHPGWEGKHFPENGKYLLKNLQTNINGFVVLTEWHKLFFQKYYKLDPSKIFIIGNGLIDKYFHHDVKKIKNRFIYTSSPKRGLDKLVEYFHEIHKLVPDATLYIYRGLDDFNKESLQILKDIEDCDYITYGGKIPQQELAVEFLKSDFWFYPTKFAETYCMSALEAQRGGCVCIASKLAALICTVARRGILIESKLYSEEYKEECITKIVDLCNNPQKKKIYQEMAQDWARHQTWENRYYDWISLFNDNSSKDISIRTKVVNLDKREDRWTKFKELSEKNGFVNYERFSAVDGYSLSPTPELKHLFRKNDFNYRKGVIGCALSHKKLWEELVEDDADYYLILEDDIEFCDNFVKKLESVRGQLVDNPSDVIYLGYSVRKQYFDKDYYRNDDDPYVRRFEEKYKFLGGTFAYIVSKEGAKKLLAILKEKGMQNAVDYFMYHNFKNLIVSHTVPHLVYSEVCDNKEVDSDIQKNRESLF